MSTSSSTLSHPAFGGQARVAPPGHRRLALPGVATGTFWLLASVVTVLNMIGVVMVMSASSVVSVRESGAPWGYAQSQAMWTAVGALALLATAGVSMDFWRRHAWFWLGSTVALLALVQVPGLGITVNGATRWLGAGPVQVQPSEFAKLALLVFVADLLARRHRRLDDWRWTLVPVAIYLTAVTALIMLQPNLGTAIIVAAAVLVVLLASGVRLVPLLVTSTLGAAVATAFVAFTPFRRSRLLSFLDPMADPTGIGLQNVQSMVAMANGGAFGRGLGNSTVKWGYLPYAWTDFIFAVIGEEFGLAGALTVVALFGVLAVTGAWVAWRAHDRFSSLVAIGITGWLTIQAMMNIGAVIGIMPIAGVPLPFVSYGGSSLVVNMAALGMLLNIARHPAPTTPGVLAETA
ncbi:stage V sporulation protein E [soil metagenome]